MLPVLLYSVRFTPQTLREADDVVVVVQHAGQPGTLFPSAKHLEIGQYVRQKKSVYNKTERCVNTGLKKEPLLRKRTRARRMKKAASVSRRLMTRRAAAKAE